MKVAHRGHLYCFGSALHIWQYTISEEERELEEIYFDGSPVSLSVLIVYCVLLAAVSRIVDIQ